MAGLPALLSTASRPKKADISCANVGDMSCARDRAIETLPVWDSGQEALGCLGACVQS